MKDHGIKYQSIMAYSPMTNGKVERMVGTVKRSLKKMVLFNRDREWNTLHQNVLYGYHRGRQESGFSPFQILHEIAPRFLSMESIPLLSVCSTGRRCEHFELLRLNLVAESSEEVPRNQLL